MNEFLAELGPGARERPAPTLKGTVAAVGSVLAVFGLMAIALDSYDGSVNELGIAFGLGATAAGYGILLRLDLTVHPAGRTLIALGTLLTLGFVLDDLDAPTLLLALLAAAYVAQWAWGPARGSTILLTLGLLSLWGFVIDAAADDTSPGVAEFGDAFEPIPNTSFTSGEETIAYVSLAIGALLLFGARALDRSGWLGVATSAIIAGDVAFVVGTFGVVAAFDSDLIGSLSIVAAGLVLALVGATAGRRFTTWLGGIGVLVGLIALIGTTFDFSDPLQFGIVAVVIGVAIIAIAAIVQPEMFRSGPEPASMAAAPLDVPGSAQGWHPDPVGRHELRWHDGTAWTANVSDDGETSTDEGM